MEDESNEEMHTTSFAAVVAMMNLVRPINEGGATVHASGINAVPIEDGEPDDDSSENSFFVGG
ncbi:unnamed protein product [Arabis nemorensis]|uniref:Uncharacterized protein n=1 Tax=Arabis nemorensis TaxID=586526 RepID=A0A565CB66_9BRAS|nr:unnamed protein product [Arabis nemorensis]